MLLLDKVTKKFLEQSFKKEFGISLSEAFKQLYTILKEDSNQVEFDKFSDRCNWALSKIVESKETLLQYVEVEKFKDIFKNVSISQAEDKISLAINNNEVTGNSRILAITLIMYSFALYTNFTTLGDNFNKVGGALIEKYSETLTLEFGKRCDLSPYSLNGDVVRAIGSMIHSVNPFINIITSILGMLLIKRDFNSSVQTLVLLVAKSVKSQVSSSVGYLYTVLTKSSQLLSIDLEFLAKDIYYQFKSIVTVE